MRRAGVKAEGAFTLLRIEKPLPPISETVSGTSL
jgi:hypothetical protein